MSQENNNDVQAFEDTSHYTRNHYQSTSLNQLTNSISSAVSQLEAENRVSKKIVKNGRFVDDDGFENPGQKAPRGKSKSEILITKKKIARSTFKYCQTIAKKTSRKTIGNMDWHSEAPIDKQALHERLQTIKTMCELCESILGIKPSIGYHPQGQAQNHLQMRPQNGEGLMPTFPFGAHSMLTTKPPTPERMVEETNRPSSPSHSHDNSTSVNLVDNFSPAFLDIGDTDEQTNNYNNDNKPNLQMPSLNGINNNNRRNNFNNYNNGSSSSNNSINNNSYKKKSAFTVWVAWRGRPSSDAQLRQIFSGLDIKDVRPSPNKSFAHIDFSTAESMNKALERNNEDIPNFGHLRVEKGNPHPRPTMGKNHSLPSSSSTPQSSSSLQSPNSPQSHSSPKQPLFSSIPPLSQTPTSFPDNRPRQQNQQNRKNEYNRGAYSTAFTSRQNSSNINFDDGMDENQKASSIKSWQDMAAQSQGTTSIPNHQEHKGNNGDM
ncbi:1488_t:CDS:10 [Paraglomus occultum]|uniref:1488_t:CDS:1 n=1 Tax=Paraglomus occultum TaxID=144539 RepID=A0A9N8ZYN6_9GLOM|nr:1488_t:CDS:10 [Paraglomus occultum]